MNKLEDFVPPVELCKQIPDGCFKDSVFVYWHGNLCRRAYFDFPGVIPAPTLPEILLTVEDAGLYCPTCYHQSNRWVVDCADDPVDEDADKNLVIYDAEDYDNPATAALRLWFQLERG